MPYKSALDINLQPMGYQSAVRGYYHDDMTYVSFRELQLKSRVCSGGGGSRVLTFPARLRLLADPHGSAGSVNSIS